MSICSIAFFNTFGIATTKYASAAQRSTIDTSRTILIWFLSCIMIPNTFWEFPSLIGFAMLATGTLVFNEIIIIPCMGFDTNTAEAIAKRKNKDPNAAAAKNYVSFSPHAAYDAQRQKRALHNPETQGGVVSPVVGNRTRSVDQPDRDDDYLMNTTEMEPSK